MVWWGVAVSEVDARASAFEEFVRTDGERLRRGLVAHYGVEIGSDAAGEAIRVAWERWDEIAAMDNPVGYLFRVGQSRVRPQLGWRRRKVGLFRGVEQPAPVVDLHQHDDLVDVLDRLPTAQRSAVLLIKAHGYSYAETAELLGISEAAVTNHLHRGLKRLRASLEATT